MRTWFVVCALSTLAIASSDAVAQESMAPQAHSVLDPAGLGGETAPDVGPGYFDDFEQANIGEYDLEAPDLDFVWVDGHVIPDGTPSEGFYRRRARPGLTWVDARYSNGSWIQGGWQPDEIRKGQIWVEGHRGNDGYWVSGNWRPEVLPGYVWQPPRNERQARILGSWEPMEVLRDTSRSIWVAGYWDSNGAHLEGFWRAVSRPGYTWVAGHYRYGEWRPGYWQPNKARNREAWSPGFWDGKAWKSGKWRPETRPGFSWVEAYRGFHGRWIKPHWQRLRRKAPRYHRVFRVDDLAKVRDGHKTVWRVGQRGHQRLQPRVQRGPERTQRDHRRVHSANKRDQHRHDLMQRKHERIERRRRRKARQKKANTQRPNARRKTVRTKR